MVYTYYSVLYGGFENEKKKGKTNLTLRSGDLNPGFLDNLIWIFREGEGDEIKYRQPFKRDRTLINFGVSKQLFVDTELA